MEVKGQTRLFQELDSGKSVHGKQESGVKALDIAELAKKSPAKAFFAALFGTQIQVEGKTYVIGTKSAKAFLERNHVKMGKADSKALVTALKGFYAETGTRTKLAINFGKDEIKMPFGQLEAAMKAVGIKDPSALKEQLGKNGIVDTTRDKLFTALHGVKDQIKAQKGSEFENFAVWLKKSVESHKVPDGAGGGVDGFIEDEKEMLGAGVVARMKSALEQGMVAEIKDEAGAKDFLQKLIANLNVDQFKKEARNELTNNLTDYRKELAPAQQGAFDAVVKHLGYDVKNDHLVDTRLHKK